MFEIGFNSDNQVIVAGRLDASHSDEALRFLDTLTAPCVVNLEKVEYISSAGLGALLATQQRLAESHGGGLRLIKLNKHLSEIFRIAGFDQVFDIEFET
ncbi:MAG: STAS domain-containing protein [Rhodothermales bacterium]|nr:STAS domain-containing protein [Rhodothermales bacterium]